VALALVAVVCVLQPCRDESEPEMIEDMMAEKPEGWLDDEPELVADDSAEKPSDWSVKNLCTLFNYTVLHGNVHRYIIERKI